MLFQRPMIFFSCGCDGATGATPSNVDVTKSSKYPALASANAIRPLGVTPGGTQQVYLTGTTLPGFLWMNEDGLEIVNTTPALTLPTATSGDFSRIMVATAAEPAEWQMLNAPGSGNYTLALKDGEISLAAFGEIPNDILGPSGATHSPLILVGIRNVSGSTWVTEKLEVAADRVLVGHSDGLGVKSLALGEFLVHPKGQFNELRLTTYEQLDSGGAAITGGIAPGVNDGANNVLAIYNTATKRFFRAMDRVAVEKEEPSTVAIAEGGVWRVIDPHCKTTQTFHFPNAYVSAYIRTLVTTSGAAVEPGDYNVDFGLFVDGALWSNAGTPVIWDVKGAKDNYVSALIIGLDLGSHTVEIRVRKDHLADKSQSVIESRMSLFTVL